MAPKRYKLVKEVNEGAGDWARGGAHSARLPRIERWGRALHTCSRRQTHRFLLGRLRQQRRQPRPRRR